MTQSWLFSRRILLRLFAIALPLAAGLYVPVANAHAMLVKSDPGRRAALSQAPAQVRLWFNERLEATYSSASIAKTGGSALSTPPATVSADDPKLLIIKLPVLDPGAYEVRYRVLSVDGHVIESKFNFTVKPKTAAKPLTKK